MLQFVLLLYLSGLSLQQNITILKYDGQPQTACKDELLNHQIILRSTLDITGYIDEFFDVFYEIKEKDSNYYATICLLNLTTCKKAIKNTPCYCLENSTSEVFSVVIKINAKASFSQAMFRGVIRFNDREIPGNEEQLPIIYDSVDPRTSKDLSLYINNVNIDLENCSTVINESTAIIVFRKFDTISSPYKLEIADSISQNVLKRGNDFVSCILHVERNAKLTLKYEAYGLEKNRRTIKCNIYTELKLMIQQNITSNDISGSDSVQVCDYLLYGLSVAILLLLISIILLFICYICFTRKHTDCKLNKNQQDTADHQFSDIAASLNQKAADDEEISAQIRLRNYILDVNSDQ